MAASPSADLLAALGVSAPRFVARTAIATVWRVVRADGTPAALKAWHDGDMRNEAPGLDLMSAWGGAGAARIYRRQEGAVLMERLDGPSLGDMTRAGDDDGAARLLAEVANALQAARPRVPPGLPRLSDWFEALLLPHHVFFVAGDVLAGEDVLAKLLVEVLAVLPEPFDQHGRMLDLLAHVV